MTWKQTRIEPAYELLESRLALSHVATGEVSNLVNGSGKANLAELQVMAIAYPSRLGDTNYNPAVDLNHDGKVDQYDARLLEKELPKPPPGTPLTLTLHLAPGEAVLHPGTIFNSGAVAARRFSQVTIIGRTIPGALVFADSNQGLYKFDGPLLPTNAEGFFSYTLELTQKFDGNVSFLVIDPLGRQLVRNYPIFRA
jgi:hypothetical protein